VAGWVAAATPVPSGLWRLLLAAGVPAGMRRETIRALYDAPGWGSLYLLVLSLLLFGLALLTLGLVQPWGEVVPTWLPWLGDRRVHRRVAVATASVGAIGLTALWLPVAVTWWSHGSTTSYTSPTAHTAVGLLYAPMALWGPLLAVVTVAYARRTRREPQAGPRSVTLRCRRG
jgi:hypothetical protein